MKFYEFRTLLTDDVLRQELEFGFWRKFTICYELHFAISPLGEYLSHMFYLVFGLVAVCTIIFFVLMFFVPEWVGISGEETLRTLESHKSEIEKSDSEAEKE